MKAYLLLLLVCLFEFVNFVFTGPNKKNLFASDTESSFKLIEYEA